MYKYLFGPVPSRRLGISLGVDMVTHKICSLDCIYCECGKTTLCTLERREYVPFNGVVKELDHYFANHPEPDYITFSGSGEPTLNSRIGDVLDFIKSRKPHLSVAVLTNGTLLGTPGVPRELMKADLVMPSLDAALPRAFEMVNRPHRGIDLGGYIQGLMDFSLEYRKFHGKNMSPGKGDKSGKLALEILVLPGINDSPEDIAALKDVCVGIAPDVIQLNTLDRPGAVEGIRAASLEELKSTASALGGNGMKIEIIAAVKERKEIGSYRLDMESAIMETIHRRPCTVKDLADVLGTHVNEIGKYISSLEKEGKIISVPGKRGIFYKTAMP
ncbi:MAG: radical SAM protein [Desulfamplus sp.]|nr:radical SAM protein [Desulfamplus sp.]